MVQFAQVFACQMIVRFILANSLRQRINRSVMAQCVVLIRIRSSQLLQLTKTTLLRVIIAVAK